jgi:hypothetical protein
LDGGWRTGTYQTFAEGQKGIKVVTFAHVHKVIMDAKGDPVEAAGVKVERFGEILYFKVCTKTLCVKRLLCFKCQCVLQPRRTKK